MFGYLTICRDELKVKDERTYKSWYCGVCEELKVRHGQFARMTLTYDMTFLAILLQGVYEGHTTNGMRRCLPHPLKKHPVCTGEMTAYAADMNLLLAYYDILDDWEDERKYSAWFMCRMLKKPFEKVCNSYPRQKKAVETYLKGLKACELDKSTDIDLASGLTGQLMKEIFTPREDAFSEILGKMGFQLGKFIYLMDAWEDVEEDKNKGNYNPFSCWATQEDFDEKVYRLLMLIMADAAREFEKLPIEENVDILRNILYCGIWSKYQMAKKRKKEKESDRSL